MLLSGKDALTFSSKSTSTFLNRYMYTCIKETGVNIFLSDAGGRILK